VAELVLRGVCASRPLLENRDCADARGGLQHRRAHTPARGSGLHAGIWQRHQRDRHRNTQRNANLEFAGKSGDLSVSYDRVGDVLVAQGNLPEALKSYRDGLAIADRLAKADPGNAGWQRDLSVSYAKLADVSKRSGETATALDMLQQGRAIIVRLTTLSPDNAVWKRDLARFDRQITAGPLITFSFLVAQIWCRITP
jgi:tetratricopeptide (TPR) repeat protein